MSEVAVVGGGAAGMVCALTAARRGHRVCIYEKNEKLGKKLFITGKGRCNLTNACADGEEFLDHVVTNRKFLYSSFYRFTNLDVLEWFGELGLAVSVERGDRVFPTSGHAYDVIDVLKKALKKEGVRVRLGSAVERIETQEGRVTGILLSDGSRHRADRAVIATGGMSYPSTGSTGDGYRMARELGHTVTPLYPSLTPFEVKEQFAGELMGLSLKNVSMALWDGRKKLYEGFGEMLFTHFGVSGPLVLSASSYAAARLSVGPLRLRLDLKPALTAEQLEDRLVREFEQNRSRQFKNAVSSLFPSKLTPVMIELSGIRPEKKAGEVSAAERRSLAELIKGVEMTVLRLRGFDEAVITKGGVAVKEVSPTTMESKLVKGLYLIGEVLDLDALTGGYNLQIAWSTAYAAGTGIE